jgi:hypothetical protein
MNNTLPNQPEIPDGVPGLPYESDIAVSAATDDTWVKETTKENALDEVVVNPSLPPTQDHSSDTMAPSDDSNNVPNKVVDDEADDEIDTVVVLTRQGPNPNSEMSSNPSLKLKPNAQWRDGENLFLISCTAQEFNRIVTHIKRVDPTTSDQGKLWKEAVSAGKEVMPRADVGLEALLRETSIWRQSVRSGGEGSNEMGAGRPPIASKTGEQQLRGEEALHHLQMWLGNGQITRIPLWHSGIWVTFKAPTEAQLLELDRRISNEKILLGRATNGLAYSNMSVYHNSFLFNFALAMVIDCSIAGYTLDTLKKKILLPDLPLLLWGLLSTIYPNGYRYHRPCIQDPSVCIAIAEELLDISRLCWTDNNALNEVQRKHMVRKSTKFTDIELTNYVAQHQFNNKGTVLCKDLNGQKTVLELRVPTLADYEASGYSWVEGIITSADQAFGSQLGADERNEYILDQARITALRQYAHWIERITFSDGKYIEDRPTLENLVGQLTGDHEVSTNLMEGVRKFINEATISQIAIPSYKCPSCQTEQNNPEEAKHPHLIPLDIGTIFFILLGQRTALTLTEAVL